MSGGATIVAEGGDPEGGDNNRFHLPQTSDSLEQQQRRQNSQHLLEVERSGMSTLSNMTDRRGDFMTSTSHHTFDVAKNNSYGGNRTNCFPVVSSTNTLGSPEKTQHYVPSVRDEEGNTMNMNVNNSGYPYARIQSHSSLNSQQADRVVPHDSNISNKNGMFRQQVQSQVHPVQFEKGDKNNTHNNINGSTGSFPHVPTQHYGDCNTTPSYVTHRRLPSPRLPMSSSKNLRVPNKNNSNNETKIEGVSNMIPTQNRDCYSTCQVNSNLIPHSNTHKNTSKAAKSTMKSPLETLAMACLMSDSAESQNSYHQHNSLHVNHRQTNIPQPPLPPSHHGFSNAPPSPHIPKDLHIDPDQPKPNAVVAETLSSSPVLVTPNNTTSDTTSPLLHGLESNVSINDVLCGRGGLTNHHPGNIFFRKLVRRHQEAYLLASKRDKASVAKKIVDTIRSLDPPGRFLKKTKEPKNSTSGGSSSVAGASGVWVEIGDRKAREKTSQALRERAPELREELECQSKHQPHMHSPQVLHQDTLNRPLNLYNPNTTTKTPTTSQSKLISPLSTSSTNNSHYHHHRGPVRMESNGSSCSETSTMTTADPSYNNHNHHHRSPSNSSTTFHNVPPPPPMLPSTSSSGPLHPNKRQKLSRLISSSCDPSCSSDLISGQAAGPLVSPSTTASHLPLPPPTNTNPSSCGLPTMHTTMKPNTMTCSSIRTISSSEDDCHGTRQGGSSSSSSSISDDEVDPTLQTPVPKSTPMTSTGFGTESTGGYTTTTTVRKSHGGPRVKMLKDRVQKVA